MLDQPNPSTSLFSTTAWKQRLVFWAGATVVGLLIVSLTLLSEWASGLSRQIFQDYRWLAFIVSPAGLTLTAWLTFRFFPGSERSGVPQVKVALEITGNLEQRSKLLSLRIVAGKIGLAIMGLLSGASVGLGGPSVQIGASIMASLGRAVRFPPHYLEKGLILAGSSAGFAAMFSAPLAGIVFAIEEMGRALEEEISSLVLTAIIFAGITAYAILHTYVFFDDRSLIMPWDQRWIAVPLCGIVGGFFGGLFSTIIIAGGRLIGRSKRSIVFIAFLCGCAIALIGYISGGETFGSGYQETQFMLHSASPVHPGYPFLKMLATIATVFSGIPSGLFVPSLAIGAGLGADLGHLYPIAPITAMILLTMTAYFSGMLQSPITSFVIVMEITDTHEILIPLMATAFFATGTSKLICPVPLYRALCDAYKQKKQVDSEKTEQSAE
jgi:chloride channel protein, CIC family